MDIAVNSNEKVSVIVPVYNVEQYLDKSVSSIVRQTYKAIEIILVDDGSTDHSPQLCDRWAEKDGRIKVIHKENGGLSDARNYGIEAASGAFLCFVDSDDWLETNTIEKAVSAMAESAADVIIWSISVDSVDQNEKTIGQRTMSSDALCRSGQDYDAVIRSGGIALYAWNKLYKTELIRKNRIRYEKGISLVEDMLFNAQVLTSAEIVRFIPFVGTHYVQRERTTLGTAYYPDCLALLLRSVEANEKIFKAFGAPENVVEQWESKAQFSCLLQSVRNICHAGKLSFREKRAHTAALLRSDTARNILNRSQNRLGKHNALYRIAMKLKLSTVIVFVEKLRCSQLR